MGTTVDVEVAVGDGVGLNVDWKDGMGVGVWERIGLTVVWTDEVGVSVTWGNGVEVTSWERLGEDGALKLLQHPPKAATNRDKTNIVRTDAFISDPLAEMDLSRTLMNQSKSRAKKWPYFTVAIHPRGAIRPLSAEK